jgi:2-polyprenyl-3-methyl-5-hydroxy-6-metoxy-1,4-benzoquinol methylase
MTTRPCRFCATELRHIVADLGMSPVANAFRTEDQLDELEAFFPLRAYVCEQCFLVQLGEFRTPEQLFTDYAYFSSYSDTWLQHAEEYAVSMIERFAIGPQHKVVEIASNDGYLLRNFAARGIPVLGVEPAANVARVAEEAGIPTRVEFLGTQVAEQLKADGFQADLLVGNNVLAHVPDVNDFVEGLARLLKPNGVLTMEFPHLLRLITKNMFDTIYHEHFSYFSFYAAERLFAAHGLAVFDVEKVPTHGGSLRVFVAHRDAGIHDASDRVSELRAEEAAFGVDRVETYAQFSEQVKETKRSLLQLLLNLRGEGKTIVGYGAPAKGNTLLNYCGIRTDILNYTVDRSPHKQGLFLPGTHIPIHDPDYIRETQPDYVLILPWNLRDEVVAQMHHIRDWGGRFIVAIPFVEVID